MFLKLETGFKNRTQTGHKINGLEINGFKSCHSNQIAALKDMKGFKK